MSLFDTTGSDRSVSTAILEAVAEKAAVDPTALPPLYERVDVDALEELFQPTVEGGNRTGTVEFQYYGHDITVEYDVGTAGRVGVESIGRE